MISLQPKAFIMWNKHRKRVCSVDYNVVVSEMDSDHNYVRNVVKFIGDLAIPR